VFPTGYDSGVNLVWNLGVVDPGENIFSFFRPNFLPGEKFLTLGLFPANFLMTALDIYQKWFIQANLQIMTFLSHLHLDSFALCTKKSFFSGKVVFYRWKYFTPPTTPSNSTTASPKSGYRDSPTSFRIEASGHESPYSAHAVSSWANETAWDADTRVGHFTSSSGQGKCRLLTCCWKIAGKFLIPTVTLLLPQNKLLSPKDSYLEKFSKIQETIEICN